MQRRWRVFDCLFPVLGAALAMGGCGDDGDGGAPGFDARQASDANGPGIDANLNDAAVNDAAVNDAATDDADLADADTTDAGAVTGVVLNEVLLDQLGASDTNEFAELKGEPTTDYSGFTLLQVDGDEGGNPGLILTAHPGCTTNVDGYCEIQVAGNSFQNGTQSLLLVTGTATFVGADIDANDDGVVDNAIWDQLVDAVAIFDNKPLTDNLDRTYSGNAILTKVIDVVNDVEEPVAFGGASRIPDGTDTDEAADWTSNTPDFTNAGIQSGEANNTPGAVNTVAP